MKTLRRIAPAHVLPVVLIAAAVAVSLMGCSEQVQPARSQDDSINAGLSNRELVNRAIASMRNLSSCHIDLTGPDLTDPASGKQSKVSIEGTVDRTRGIEFSTSRVKFSTDAYTDERVMVPAEEREIIGTSDGKFYESTDGGKSWHVPREEETYAMGWGLALIVMSHPWYGVASPPLTFSDGDPRLENVDGTLTRHVVADLTELGSDHSWDLGAGPAGALELWISTDTTPLIYKMVARGTQVPPSEQAQEGDDQEEGQTPEAGVPYTHTWTWSRLNEDLGEIKLPESSTSGEQSDAEGEIHPQKSLGTEANADYLLLMDFSDDSSLLAALVHNTWTPGEPAWSWLREIGPGFANGHKPAAPKVVLWRVPDWKRVGVIQPGQNSISLDQLSAGKGAGAKLVAEVSPEYDQVYVRRADDKSLVTTIDFRNPPGPLPEGFSYDAGTLNSSHHFVFVRTPDGRNYKLSPKPVMDWVPWSPEDFAISPDGKYIANGYDQECMIWVWALPDVETGTGSVKPPATATPQLLLQSKPGEPQYLAPLATLDIAGAYGGNVAPEGVPGSGLFSPDGQYVVTDVHQGDVNTSPDYHSALVVWRTSDWQRVLTRTLELGFPTFTFSPDSKTLAVGSDGGTIALYSTSDWTAFLTLKVEPDQVRVAFVPDGSALASASGASETIRFWSTSDWSELRTQQIDDLCEYCYFNFSPDGKFFTANLDEPSAGIVNIWRVEDGSLERTVTLPKGTLAGSPSFSRDGSVIKALASTGSPLVWDEDYKTELYMWNVADGQLVTEDPDKGTLEGGGENIYRNGDPEPVYVLRRTAFPDLPDTGFFGSFSPDGRTIVGTCGEHALCVWKLP